MNKKRLIFCYDKNKMKNNNWSFTLIEIMIVIAILGVLASIISGNFITSLKKGRDARRKADLEQTQRALEMYYEDMKAYPTAAITPGFPFGNKFCQTENCSNDKIYMQKVPTDPKSNFNYQYLSDGTYYRLFSCIENSLDQGEGVSQEGFVSGCGGCGKCKYTISSPNITPLP